MDSSGFTCRFSPAPPNNIGAINFYVWHGRLLCDAAGIDQGSIQTRLATCNVLHSFGFGQINEKDCVLHVLNESFSSEDHVHFTDFRMLVSALPEAMGIAANHALQVSNWLSANQYCGSCGKQLLMASDELRMDCSSCSRRTYPTCTPVCIGVVTRGREVLLARSPHFPPGVYSALAGYLQPGESAESCIRREIYEETGIHITAPRWCGSQAWPYPHNLMLGFRAEYESGEINIDRTEIEDAAWFHVDRLPLLPHVSTLGYQLIQSALSDLSRLTDESEQRPREPE